jgi:hypothetical protein
MSVTPKPPTVQIGHDKVSFEVRSNQAGYIYVYLLSTNGHLWLLFPNQLDIDNQIGADQTLTLPRSNWPLEAEGPSGTDRFVLLVSQYQRDFTNSGWHEADAFHEFRLPDLNLGPPEAIRGKPICDTLPCEDVYGAVSFQIEKVESEIQPPPSSDSKEAEPAVPLDSTRRKRQKRHPPLIREQLLPTPPPPRQSYLPPNAKPGRDSRIPAPQPQRRETN